jgi:hypothetical protein
MTVAAQGVVPRERLYGERAMLQAPLEIALAWPEVEIPALVFLGNLVKSRREVAAEFAASAIALIDGAPTYSAIANRRRWRSMCSVAAPRPAAARPSWRRGVRGVRRVAVAAALASLAQMAARVLVVVAAIVVVVFGVTQARRAHRCATTRDARSPPGSTIGRRRAASRRAFVLSPGCDSPEARQQISTLLTVIVAMARRWRSPAGRSATPQARPAGGARPRSTAATGRRRARACRGAQSRAVVPAAPVRFLEIHGQAANPACSAPLDDVARGRAGKRQRHRAHEQSAVGSTAPRARNARI